MECERGKSGWSSSQSDDFAYHHGYLVVINHHSYGELNLFAKSR